MSDLELSYKKINDTSSDTIAFLTLNRPEFANALSFDLMKSMTKLLGEIEKYDKCRLLVLRAKGKHFSAGADLAWMQAAKDMTREQNQVEAEVLQEMFEKLFHFPKPVIGVVRGAAYGGALGLLAACDSVICSKKARFCLSEINLGLAPAVILPYLSRKMQASSLKRLALTGVVFSGEQAKETGLVNFCLEEDKLQLKLKEEISLFLSSAPRALSELKSFYQSVLLSSHEQSSKSTKFIARLRREEEAQHGLSSFFEKKKPLWSLTLKDDWSCDV